MKNTSEIINDLRNKGMIEMNLKQAQIYVKNTFGLTLKLDGSYINRLNPGKECNYYFSKITDETGLNWCNINSNFYKNHKGKQLFDEFQKFRDTLIVHRNKIVQL